eukprot:scaffold221345_cov31-Prasinocladus_malaysianus.AAC.1
MGIEYIIIADVIGEIIVGSKNAAKQQVAGVAGAHACMPYIMVFTAAVCRGGARRLVVLAPRGSAGVAADINY